MWYSLSPEGLLENAVNDADQLELPDLETLNRELHGYEVLHQVGRGGMGVVFKAKQLSLGRVVAIKVLLPESARAWGVVERFQQEARVMAQLNHPNIVSIHDFGITSAGMPFFIMEFMEGGDLAQKLASGRLPPPDVLRFSQDIADALAYAHGEGVVHRDLKPANVMLDRHGRAKVADFGLAKLLERAPISGFTSLVGDKMGTPEYVAPEQLSSDGEVDHRADLYAFGVMFYEMLTGERPRGKWSPLSSENKGLTTSWDRVADLTLAPSPEERFQSSADLLKSLSRLRPHNSPQFGWVVATAFSILFFVGILGLVWNAKRPKTSPRPEVYSFLESPLRNEPNLRFPPSLLPEDSAETALKRFLDHVEKSGGYIGDNFAILFRTNMPEVPPLETGFRLASLKVMRSNPNEGFSPDTSLTCTLWIRDFKPWFWGHSLTMEQTNEISKLAQNKSFELTETSYYRRNQAIWTNSTHDIAFAQTILSDAPFPQTYASSHPAKIQVGFGGSRLIVPQPLENGSRVPIETKIFDWPLDEFHARSGQIESNWRLMDASIHRSHGSSDRRAWITTIWSRFENNDLDWRFEFATKPDVLVRKFPLLEGEGWQPKGISVPTFGPKPVFGVLWTKPIERSVQK